MTPEQAVFREMFRAARPQRLRTIHEFAEQEIVHTTGPFKDYRFRIHRQPFVKLLFDEIMNPAWREIAVTGTNQSGKTVAGFIIPTMYHLFEMRESVICGVPNRDIGKEKWIEHLKPMIEASRYRDMLPLEGDGSQGGYPSAIKFRNGTVLRFLTAGGSDKSRSSYTSRVIMITEVDGFDEVGGTSRESTKLRQLKARALSEWNRRRIYMECTVSIETGSIWTEYNQGTASRIMLPCPHCRHYVRPEREHFIGWETAPDLLTAATMGRIHCPNCGQQWNDAERKHANHHAILLHRGQSIDEKHQITGPVPAVETLGFRWTGVNNLFWDSADIAKMEWKAAHAPDPQLADLAIRQQTWTTPAEPNTTEHIQLTAFGLASRQMPTPRGLVPADCQSLVMGIDLGKRFFHWVLVAYNTHAVGTIVDYGQFPVPWESMALEESFLYTLREARLTIEQGYNWHDHAGEKRIPDQVWIDSGYQGKSEGLQPVYAFVRESGPLNENRYAACKGHGERDGRNIRYRRPTAGSKSICVVGDEYHFTHEAAAGIYRVDVNGDYWKTRVHERLNLPMPGPEQSYKSGTLALFRDVPHAHQKFCQQLTAEKQEEIYIDGRGYVSVWTPVSRANHYLDALYMALAAAHFCGVRIAEETTAPHTEPPAEPAPQPNTLTTPDGRAFFVGDRS